MTIEHWLGAERAGNIENFHVGQLVHFNPKCDLFEIPSGIDESMRPYYEQAHRFAHLLPFITHNDQSQERRKVDTTLYGLVLECLPHGPQYVGPKVLMHFSPMLVVLFGTDIVIVPPTYITKI